MSLIVAVRDLGQSKQRNIRMWPNLTPENIQLYSVGIVSIIQERLSTKNMSLEYIPRLERTIAGPE